MTTSNLSKALNKNDKTVEQESKLYQDLLNQLSQLEENEVINPVSVKEDYDLGEVLTAFSDTRPKPHLLRFSDGTVGELIL